MATRKPTQPAAPAKAQTPPTNDNIAAPVKLTYTPEEWAAEFMSLDARLASTEREYAEAVASVGRLGDVLRELRAELAAQRA